MTHEHVLLYALDVRRGFARVITKDQKGNIICYGKQKSITAREEMSYQINDLCVGAQMLGYKEIFVIMRDQESNCLEIRQYDGNEPILPLCACRPVHK